jgi:lysophospholipase L1-like esterase
MKTVLCYGDSNTWGAAPMRTWADSPRLPHAERYTSVVAAALGDGWHVVAEGLPGRTTVHPDPVEGGHLSALAHVRACLESHRPLDIVVVMLGTNDFKRRFSLEAEDVALGVRRLLREIRGLDVFGGKPARFVVVCPPPVVVTGIFTTMYRGAAERSRQLPPLLRDVAAEFGAAFIDSGSLIMTSPIDGIHLDAGAHRTLGLAVADAVRTLDAHG